ncbi:tripartite tricarboxylate transporter substrate binding protein [Bordetella sp. BOR01]|uniref:Bug family tripartite tricarboxylate transporter substrate binding protein n=1 Tax=Bordetella sp. BOR01 TaxID=2854779 RepID=UPI001C453500|nr:tripartite tricarboxylate transporter substrate binding protein [Bordetella sp. BOR01]MBV7483671.1 tripartite tricarboxylate transporter substrate binding protein [Bordetella sp. BOR01]
MGSHSFRLSRPGAAFFAGLAASLFAGMALVSPGMSLAQDYPGDRPIRLVVPWPVGGVTDAASRILASRLGEKLGTTIVVENRSGANGRVGTDYAAAARPDGYTLFVASAETHAINPHVYAKLSYDPVKAFVPVAPFAVNPFSLVARPDLKADTLQDIIELAKASPGKLTFASWGIGSTSQIGMEMLKDRDGLQMLHVPFQGEAPAVNALMAGQVDLMVLPVARAKALSADGKVKVYSMMTRERSFVMPDLPSLEDMGVKGIDVVNWFAVVAPAKTPGPIVQRVAAAIDAIIQSPDAIASFRALGVDVHRPMSPAELKRFIDAETLRWGDVISKAHIKLDG